MIASIIRKWAAGATVDKESLVKALRDALDDFANATCPYCGRKFYRDPRGLLENPFCSECVNDRSKPLPPGEWVETFPGYMRFIPCEEEHRCTKPSPS